MQVTEDSGGRNNGAFQVQMTGDELAQILGLASVEELYEVFGSFEDAVKKTWADLPEPIHWQTS